jgi:uncharacterized protein YecT (DUF1311 family)
MIDKSYDHAPEPIKGETRMNRRKTIALGVVGCALALVAAGLGAAAIRGGGQSYAQCLKTAQTTAAMQACITAEHKRVDAQLNKVYGQLAKAGVDKPLLLKAENNWIAFRDADCKFVASFNAGGTLASVNQGDCLITNEAARVKQLQSYLKQATQH